MYRTTMACAVALTAGLLSLVAPAHAADWTIGAAAYEYAPPDLTIRQGDTITFANADPFPHNIASDVVVNGKYLFISDTITAGKTAAVRGVDKLKPGVYGYYCSIHPEMRGTLRVGAAAAGNYVALPTGGEVPTPTSIAFFQGAMYVSSYGAGTVTKLTVLPGGALAPGTPYAQGFSGPLGVAFAPDGTMFVSDSHAAGNETVGRVWAVPPGGGDKQVVVDGLPNGRHNTNGLSVHRGRLYITNGNNTDDGVAGGPREAPLSGTLLSVPLTARNVAPKPGRQLLVEAKGMRNLYDVAFRPGTNEAWIPTNGPDALDPWGEDTLNMLDVRGGTVDFAFPACVWKAGANGAPEWAQNPAVTTRCTGKQRRPEALFGLHVSADGLAFAPNADGFAGELFVALFGNNPGESNAGRKIVRVPIVKGKAGQPVDVVPGSSPLDVTFGPAGTGLYVADFATGAITLVRPVG